MRNDVLVLLICIIFLSQLNHDKVKSSWYTATSVGKDAQYTKTRKGFNALLSKIQRGSILFIFNSMLLFFFLENVYILCWASVLQYSEKKCYILVSLSPQTPITSD